MGLRSWHSPFLRKLDFDYMNLTQRSRAQAPAMIWDDSQTTIKWLRNYGHHAKTKHIDTAILSIREHVIEFKTLDVDYVDTTSQIADALTKSLPPAHHWNLVRFMLGKQVPSQFWKRSSEPEGGYHSTSKQAAAKSPADPKSTGQVLV